MRLVTDRLVPREFDEDDWRAVLGYACAVDRALPMRDEAALREEHSMPTYVMLMKWTEQGVKDARNALNRQEQGRAVLEQAGGRNDRRLVDPGRLRCGGRRRTAG